MSRYRLPLVAFVVSLSSVFLCALLLSGDHFHQAEAHYSGSSSSSKGGVDVLSATTTAAASTLSSSSSEMKFSSTNTHIGGGIAFTKASRRSSGSAIELDSSGTSTTKRAASSRSASTRKMLDHDNSKPLRRATVSGPAGSNSTNTTTGKKAEKRASATDTMNKVVMSTVMAPALVAGKMVHMVADAGSAAVGAGSKASNAVVDASNKASENSRKVFKGAAKGFMNVVNRGYWSKYYKNRSSAHKSNWEEGIEIIDELLDVHSETYKTMTKEQRKKLSKVKTMLLKSPTSSLSPGAGGTLHHVPKELLRQSGTSHASGGGGKHHPSSSLFNPRVSTNSTTSSNFHRRQSSNFILQEFAGIEDPMALLLDCMSEQDEDNSEETFTEMEEELSSSNHHTTSTSLVVTDEEDNEDVTNHESFTSHGDSQQQLQPLKRKDAPPTPSTAKNAVEHVDDTGNATTTSSDLHDNEYYLPLEFINLSRESQLELVELLSWESLQRWDFDVFHLNEVTNGHPLFFLGWAILGSPHARHAMMKHLGLQLMENTNTSTTTATSSFRSSISGKSSKNKSNNNHNNNGGGGLLENGGYTFMETFKIPSEKLCNYIRVIEAEYHSDNPYHNAVHAADVMQTLHSLIQKSKDEPFMKDCSQENVFAILLSALVHDVDHPGKTNSFQINLKSELSVMYNDTSVLENWHLAHAFARLLDVDLKQQSAAGDNKNLVNQVLEARKNGEGFPESKNNFLCNTTSEQFSAIRKRVIEAVLHTDMKRHFEMVNGVRGMLIQQDDSTGSPKIKAQERSWNILVFMMHMCDISNQAKAAPLFERWTHLCLEEFFAQGDEEVALGLPISLLCDRKTTRVAESQVGFIQFVVEPAFEVLGDVVPFVQKTILPIVRRNLDYWSQRTEEENSSNDSS